ncbi:predicted protein [Postia placenta Mad-698-R]|nr:predicted protein [Postia placenta Mad-698-R]
MPTRPRGPDWEKNIKKLKMSWATETIDSIQSQWSEQESGWCAGMWTSGRMKESGWAGSVLAGGERVCWQAASGYGGYPGSEADQLGTDHIVWYYKKTRLRTHGRK